MVNLLMQKSILVRIGVTIITTLGLLVIVRKSF